jgi:mono/diheme cytochrome c family protein
MKSIASAQAMMRIIACSAALVTAGGIGALAQSSARPTLSPGITFLEQSGEDLYVNICQACHMENGRGAVGAGSYPPLANNSKLESPNYAIYVVLHGLKAMPPMGKLLSDEQVATVVNYVRTHFGNAYKDPVDMQDVSDAR